LIPSIDPEFRGNYGWFALGKEGKLRPVSSDLPSYDANLVALPRERMEEFSAMAARQAC
jgi:hypothetical protein